MTKKIYYTKVGRRYVPVAEYDSDFLDSFPKGTHIVMSYPGGRSTRYNIDPALAPMIAAGRFAENKILDAMRQASEARPKERPFTEKQRKAWKQLQKAMGEEMFYLQYPSNMDIVEAGIEAMQEEANKMLEHPSVRDAYNQFMMVYKLVKEESNEG
jgi:hypothetical protein